TQHQRPQRDWQGACRLDSAGLRRCKIPLRPDPYGGRCWIAPMFGLEVAETPSWIGGLRSERSQQRQIELVTAPQNLFYGYRRFTSWQPGGAALFYGLDGDELPFLGFVPRLFHFELRHGAVRQQRHNSRRAQLCRLLDDRLERLAFGDGLKQSDRTGRRRC